MDYKNKYLKYKQKYLLLKNKTQKGGSSNIIIHISGPSGSGKSYLSSKLKDKFGSKFELIELDNVRADFVKDNYKEKDYKKIKNFDKQKFQKHLDKLIKSKDKPVIIEGLNHFHWWDIDHYYDLHATHKYYIDLDVDTVFKQKCNRYIEKTFKDKNKKDQLLNKLIKNEEFTINMIAENIKSNCSYEKILKFTTLWNKDYKKMGYNIMSRNEIFNSISEILENL
jgi:adenylate kinase family enzyme